MSNPPSAPWRILRPASLIGAGVAVVAIACLATGWLPWHVRRAFATGDLGQQGVTSVPPAIIGRCYLKADTRAWPAWLVEGLRAHPDDQATPRTASQPPAPVRATPRNG